MKITVPLGVLIIGLLLIGSRPATAEYYKYRDAQGNIRFTDNLTDVPESQRPSAKTFEEISGNTSEEDPDASAPDNNSAQANSSEEQDGIEDAEKPAPDVDEATIDALNARKEKLDREQAELMESKRNLEEERAGLESLAGRDVKARQAYEEKVKALNHKIADYQKRLKQFQKDADAVKEALKTEK
jgi:chromosome segregation ATPase